MHLTACAPYAHKARTRGIPALALAPWLADGQSPNPTGTPAVAAPEPPTWPAPASPRRRHHRARRSLAPDLNHIALLIACFLLAFYTPANAFANFERVFCTFFCFLNIPPDAAAMVFL